MEVTRNTQNSFQSKTSWEKKQKLFLNDKLFFNWYNCWCTNLFSANLCRSNCKFIKVKSSLVFLIGGHVFLNLVISTAVEITSKKIVQFCPQEWKIKKWIGTAEKDLCMQKCIRKINKTIKNYKKIPFFIQNWPIPPSFSFIWTFLCINLMTFKKSADGAFESASSGAGINWSAIFATSLP